MKRKKQFQDIKKDIPIAFYDRTLGCFGYEDGSYMDIYQIVPRDLVNSDVDEIERDCFTWAKFYKTYEYDIEFLSMKFPCNTGEQQKYWKRKLKGNKNPMFDEMLKRKIEELEYREKHAVTKQFFILFFFQDAQERREALRLAEHTLGIVRKNGRLGNLGMLEEISEKKKIQILFKLANKNSMIF